MLLSNRVEVLPVKSGFAKKVARRPLVTSRRLAGCAGKLVAGKRRSRGIMILEKPGPLQESLALAGPLALKYSRRNGTRSPAVRKTVMLASPDSRRWERSIKYWFLRMRRLPSSAEIKK